MSPPASVYAFAVILFAAATAAATPFASRGGLGSIVYSCTGEDGKVSTYSFGVDPWIRSTETNLSRPTWNEPHQDWEYRNTRLTPMALRRGGPHDLQGVRAEGARRGQS